ncbi:aldo/keto reductase [Enorma phocaeensis]|uniref:Aldo/keto reductase n=1 Tax=Enorma phocaeensis TaxID=1871019 RepID=A0A921IUC8_9ACTN|nr:aldo/keto reductase [Enorma phocaeensis]HJG37761.1 aldo/keto reductase [Enorma phocaeensis]
MRYRELGKTGLQVSEIGFGGEWVDGTPEEARVIVSAAREAGINIIDCWMPDPTRRSNLGDAIEGERERWIIQGHLGSTWQDGQYVRTRDLAQVKPAFEDLLERFHTDYMDIGMIHYVDKPEEFDELMADSPFLGYLRELHASGAVRHIGLSTHNPVVAKRAAQHPEIEMILFSVNPAFDMMPATDNLDDYFGEAGVAAAIDGMTPERAELYALCEETGTGITVMKGYMGGRLFDAATSPFGVALTPAQCLEYDLTRPAVASVMVGFSAPEHVAEAVAYETASAEERDYARVLAGAPRHAYVGQCTYCGHCAPCPKGIDIASVNKFYDLATMYDEVPDSLLEHYRALGATASGCIACHACEPRCPFGVRIAEKMAKAAVLFGC